MKLSPAQAVALRKMTKYPVIYPSDGILKNTIWALIRRELAEWADIPACQPAWWSAKITDKGRALIRQWDGNRSWLEGH